MKKSRNQLYSFGIFPSVISILARVSVSLLSFFLFFNGIVAIGELVVLINELNAIGDSLVHELPLYNQARSLMLVEK